MFREKLEKNIQSGIAGENGISDEMFEVKYRHLPRLFSIYDDFFKNHPALPSIPCFIYSCGNSVPEAVLLLWLLSRKKDFLLLPRFGKIQLWPEEGIFPEFCTHLLNIDHFIQGMNLEEPYRYIYMEPNPGYKENSEREPLTGVGNIFLKTSGSTADPKLVMHSNPGLFGNIWAAVQRLGLTSQDRVMIPVPLYHMYGLGAGFLPSAAAGASIHIIEHTNVIKYADHERKYKPSVSFMTPILCDMILKTRKTPYEYRLIVSAGDRIGKKLFEEFDYKFGKLVNLYGSTELGVIATSRQEDSREVRSDGIIEPLNGVRIRLKSIPAASENDFTNDEEEMKPEILCRHNYGLISYLDRTGEKINTFITLEETGDMNPWFPTKDMGRWIDADETIFKVIGRTGNSMNRNGILVAFSEVESVMEHQIPELQSVVVVAREEEDMRGKKMVACCQLKPGSNITGKDIRSKCFDIMQRYVVPDVILVLNELPKLPNGKHDRKRLEEHVKYSM